METQFENYVINGASVDEVRGLVSKYHYSKKVPSVVRHCFALREKGGLFGDRGDPVAAVIYSTSINQNWPKESVELGRLVRKDDLVYPLSKFIAWTLRWLKKNTNIWFVFSYSDTTQNHHGGIYQATNFKFVYSSPAIKDGFINNKTGEVIHGRTLRHKCNQKLKRNIIESNDFSDYTFKERHCYIYPLKMSFKDICKLKNFSEKPYPKPDFVDAGEG